MYPSNKPLRTFGGGISGRGLIRGGGRGSSSMRGRGNLWQPPSTTHAASQASSPPRGRLHNKIFIKDLSKNTDAANGEPRISDQESVASFNWIEAGTTTIAVPGAPPMWNPPTVPTQLSEDAGEYYRDQNGARFPNHPIQPAVQAIRSQNPSFAPSNIDIFACGSTFGNLLRFVREEGRVFRFVVEKVGQTFFFLRRENTFDEKIPDVRGYGHTFPEKYTTWHRTVSSSASHQRMVAYTFAGKRYVIRSECDGYLPDKLVDDKSKTITVDDSLPAASNNDGLQVVDSGHVVPQSAIFDLKTRSVRRKDQDHLQEQLGRLWANRTPNFVLAFHHRGLFTDIRKFNVQAEVERWEADHETQLRMLGMVVEKIVDCADVSPSGRCEVLCDKAGVLEMRDVGGEFSHALPEDLCSFWSEDDGRVPSPSIGGGDGAEVAGEASDEDGEQDSWPDSDDEEKDYTACSAESCGYCGRCTY